MAQTIAVGLAEERVSPGVFHKYACEYLMCADDFIATHAFSPVPYFLICRAIELELKSRHLESKNQSEVKKAFGHHLAAAYAALPERTLTRDEELALESISEIYAGKGFEYIRPGDLMTGFSRYPNLERLREIARKLTAR